MAGSAPLRQLGSELKRLRKAAGENQEGVAGRLGRNRGTIIAWENGARRPSASDLAAYLNQVNAPASVYEGLFKLHEDSGRKVGNWATYDLPSWLKPLVTFEEDAETVFCFEPSIVPGLLQTEDYARAIHLAAPHVTAPADVDLYVAARMQRQLRVVGPSPFSLTAVISEAALSFEVGGVEVLADQLQKLIHMTQRENVSIRIFPFTRGASPGGFSNFQILSFHDERLNPPIGYYDTPEGGFIVDDKRAIATMLNISRAVTEACLSLSDSINLIFRTLKELRGESVSSG